MKILAGIPTRLRKSAGSIADQLAPYVDKVVIVSQGAETKFSASNIYVIEQPTTINLMIARNIIIEEAIGGNYDLVVQCDDDLKIYPAIVPKMTELLNEEPHLGTISSTPRQFQRWAKGISSSKPYLIAVAGAQFWATRIDVFKEVGDYDVNFFQDLQHGLKSWEAGWISARFHIGYDLCHNPKISRMNKDFDQGGQPIFTTDERQESIDYILKHHSAMITSMSRTDIFSNRAYNARYNWKAMCQSALNRWGTIGYEDSRGNVI